MAPVAKELHLRGIRLLRYLDDWLLLANSFQETLGSLEQLLHLCQWLGIRVNWGKSSLTPSQSRTYLGMEIRSLPLKVFPTRKG